MTKCASSTAEGPCNVPAQEGSEWCWWHDPAKEEERLEASRKGGSAPNRGKPVNLGDNALQEGPKQLTTLAAVAATVEAVIGGLLAGKISVDKGRVLLHGLRVQERVLQAIDAAKVKEQLEELRLAVRRIEDDRGRVYLRR